jgi:hypothetical protein
MLKKEVFEGCKEARLHQLNQRRQVALASCSNVGKLYIF